MNRLSQIFLLLLTSVAARAEFATLEQIERAYIAAQSLTFPTSQLEAIRTLKPEIDVSSFPHVIGQGEDQENWHLRYMLTDPRDERGHHELVLVLRRAGDDRDVIRVEFWLAIAADPRPEQIYVRRVLPSTAKKPNQALQPTRMLVTFHADAWPAPSTRVADL